MSRCRNQFIVTADSNYEEPVALHRYTVQPSNAGGIREVFLDIKKSP